MWEERGSVFGMVSPRAAANLAYWSKPTCLTSISYVQPAHLGRISMDVSSSSTCIRRYPLSERVMSMN